MKTYSIPFCLLMVVAFSLPAWSAPASTSQLTVELRDGSRLVGKPMEETLGVHSAAVGDLKFPWAGVRSIEFSTGNGPARLTDTNGDSFSVQLGADALSLETSFGKTDLSVKMIRRISGASPATAVMPGGSGKSEIHLAIELRDGSQVMAKGLDDTLNFHSAGMGDMKLSWAGIRALEFKGTNDMAMLTATNGDVLDVQWLMPVIQVQTSFGKSEMPVKAIRRINVSAQVVLGQLPPGLVALWSGEGDGTDSVGGHNATLMGNVTFENGKVGRAFGLDGRTAYLTVPASPALDVGAGEGFTITAWIKPAAFNETPGNGARGPIVEYDTQGSSGVKLWAQGGNGLGANLVGPVSTAVTQIETPNGALKSSVFQHVALTYDKNTGTAALYINGAEVVTKNMGSFRPETTYPLSIGRCTGDPVNLGQSFGGLVDEVALYNRALSAEEIHGIYSGQNDGGLQFH